MSNALSDSASPYLRAHADQPVAWFPWGEAAFARARERDVPVLVSIGYATCHWCHVMARESFADPEVAAQLNADFVCVKVDREEHPDVDRAFLSAAAAFTPHLGWPLTVFTTPEGAVFFAGTYWPRRATAGVAGFPDVLAAVTEAWTSRRDDVEDTGARLGAALRQAAETARRRSALPDEDDLVAAALGLAALEDTRFGGFAAADAPMTTPKFPTVPALRLLTAPRLRARAPQLPEVAARALAAMASSPLRDTVDGGFFRYATRRDWTVPHYERMLTDNAGLLELALDLGEVDLATGIVGFLRDVLEQPTGGFASAQDSESQIEGRRSEGGYYARTAAERADLDPPALDAKVVTGWNGLAVGALARYGAVTGSDAALAAATRAAAAVLDVNRRDDGTLRRASLGEIVSPAAGTLEDYAALASGLIALACATGDPAWAVEARRFVDLCLGGAVTGDPLLREIGLAPGDDADGDHPSGPSALAEAAIRLWWLGAGDDYRREAERIVADGWAAASREPAAHAALLRTAASLTSPPRQLVVVAPPGHALRAAARGVQAEIVLTLDGSQTAAWTEAGFGLLEGKDRLAAYDCRGFVCALPTVDPDAIATSA